jgi:hypothetical protein
LYDLERGTWADQIIEAAGLHPDQLPELRR